MALQTRTGVELWGDDLRIVTLAGMTRRTRVARTAVIEGFGTLDPASQVERLAAAVAKFRIPKGNVHLTLPGSFGTIREIDIPAATAGDFAQIASLQLESISPWPIDEVWWAAGLAPESRPSAMRKVTVSIIPSDLGRSWLEIFGRAGLPLASMSLAPMVWGEGMVRLFGAERPLLCLAIAGGRVEGVLVNAAHVSVVTDVLPADDAAVRRTVLQSIADLLGSSRVEDPDAVRLLARGPVPEELAPVAVRQLPVDGGGKERDVADFGAIAAALAGGQGRSSNLIPAVDRAGRNLIRAVPTIALAAGLLLAVGALFLREPIQYLQYSDRLDAEIAQLAPLVDEVITEDSELAAAREEFALLNALIADDANLEALAWLARSMPPDTWVTSYSNQGGVLTLSGYSGGTSQFQLLLEDSELFESVELASPVTLDASGRERFTIRMNIVGNS